MERLRNVGILRWAAFFGIATSAPANAEIYAVGIYDEEYPGGMDDFAAISLEAYSSDWQGDLARWEAIAVWHEYDYWGQWSPPLIYIGQRTDWEPLAENMATPVMPNAFQCSTPEDTGTWGMYGWAEGLQPAPTSGINLGGDDSAWGTLWCCP